MEQRGAKEYPSGCVSHTGKIHTVKCVVVKVLPISHQHVMRISLLASMTGLILGKAPSTNQLAYIVGGL